MNSIGSLSFTREFKGYIFGSVKGKTLTVFVQRGGQKEPRRSRK
jgi:hypothetical protein